MSSPKEAGEVSADACRNRSVGVSVIASATTER